MRAVSFRKRGRPHRTIFAPSLPSIPATGSGISLAVQQNLAKDTTDVKWVEEENLHLTLLFLGEVEDRDLPAICRAVEGGHLSQGVLSGDAGHRLFPHLAAAWSGPASVPGRQS